MPLVIGTDLSPATQADALRKFINRFTGNHRPHRVQAHALPQFADDADWLAHTKFVVTKSGKLDARVKWCESSPTWPFGRPAGRIPIASDWMF